MTREEVKVILKKIKMNWTNYNPESVVETVDLWEECSKGVEFKYVNEAIVQMISTSKEKFPPTIGIVLDMARVIRDNNGIGSERQ